MRTPCNSSGNGEGARPFALNPAPVNTDANGNATFSIVVAQPLLPGRIITATATDPSGNTSEFWLAIQPKHSAAFTLILLLTPLSRTLASFQLQLRGAAGIGTLTVQYSTLDGSAKAGEDYVASSGTLTFLEGETSKTFNVAILNNATIEPDESFMVALKNPSDPDTVENPGVAVINLLDNTKVPALSINNVSITEGNSGTTNAVFTVTLFPATGRIVTVDYSTSGASATSGVDFNPVSGSITFNPGVTSQTISVPVIGDSIDEFNESLLVTLTNPVNADLLNNTGAANVIDDDPNVSVSISNVSVFEGNSGTTSAVFTVGDVCAPWEIFCRELLHCQRNRNRRQ